jgi:hypothetical protein
MIHAEQLCNDQFEFQTPSCRLRDERRLLESLAHIVVAHVWVLRFDNREWCFAPCFRVKKLSIGVRRKGAFRIVPVPPIKDHLGSFSAPRRV